MVRAAGATASRMPRARRGGYSSAGRAPGCGPGGRGFKSRYSPHTSNPRSASARAGGSRVPHRMPCGGAGRGPRSGRAPTLCEDGRMPSRRLAAVVTVVLVIAFVVVAVAPAFASAPDSAPGTLPFHARLLGSTPEDGSTVDTADEVVLEFNEEVDPTFVQVTVEGPDGSEVEGGPEVDGRAVTQALSPGIARRRAPRDLPGREHRRPPGLRHGDLHDDGRAGRLPEPTASVTPSPSATASADPRPRRARRRPRPRRTTRRARGRGSSAAWPSVAALVALVLGRHAALPHARRGGPTAAGGPGDADSRHRRGPPGRGRDATPSPDRFRSDGGRLIISASRAISSIGRAADS